MLVERLSQQTGRTVAELLSFAASAGLRYKVFEIEKRSGGMRKIEQPSKAVKSLQRWLMRTLFNKYNIHPCAIGYRKNISILDNAKPHLDYKFTIRLDFSDFFWSFRSEDIKRFLRDNKIEGIILSDDDIDFVADVVCRDGRLVMGAPSSPIITNIMMYEIDKRIAEISTDYDAIYTRYADDLFISSNVPHQSNAIIKAISVLLPHSNLPSLSIKTEKTAFLSKKHHRSVTGLVITPQGTVSLGRGRKRMIKALVHQVSAGTAVATEASKLSGLLNWAASIEPSFIVSLEKKYGETAVRVLRK